jgi:hypothetical protein
VSITFDTELLTGAIKCDDETVLRNFARRGSNRILSGAPGQRQNALLLDQLDETLTFKIDGRVDYTGSPHSDMVAGLEENLEHYRALFLPDVLHDISLDYAGSTFTGEVQTPEYAHARTGPISGVAIVRFIILAGELDEAP